MMSTVFTTAGKLAVPRTLSVETRPGSGRIFLDTTETTFYPEWQSQVQTVFECVRKVIAADFCCDFFISIDSKAVDGWSTSVPLFLLIAGSATGELLPGNIFSTGCMFSPDGWVSYGKFKSIQAKIDASEAFSHYAAIETPQFLIPFSDHTYRSKNVCLHPVTSVFAALERALPNTFHTYKPQIEKLSRVESQDFLKNVHDIIPSRGDVCVVVSADQSDQPEYATVDRGALFIEEDVPPDQPVYVFYIRDTTVMIKHFFKNQKKARTAALHYQEVFHEKS